MLRNLAADTPGGKLASSAGGYIALADTVPYAMYARLGSAVRWTIRTCVRILAGMRNAPWAPPLVEMSGGQVGHLLAWDQHERDGSWHAWVSWVHRTGDPPRHQHKVVSVAAGSLAPLEEPGAYREVPRRVLGNDGKIRPWAPAGPGAPGQRGLPAAGGPDRQPSQRCSGRRAPPGPARHVFAALTTAVIGVSTWFAVNPQGCCAAAGIRQAAGR